jgi:hypothetical protein
MEREIEAYRNFEMISISEGNWRKTIGLSLLFATLVVMLYRLDALGFKPSYWSFFISLGLSILARSLFSSSGLGLGVYRTGSKSQ